MFHGIDGNHVFPMLAYMLTADKVQSRYRFDTGAADGIRGIVSIRRSRAYLPELIEPRPPDLPAAMGKRLRVITEGRG